MKRQTIEQALRDSAARIGGDSPEMDAQLLLGAATGRSRSSLYAWSDKTLTAQEETEYQKLVARRCDGEPVAHLVGMREFWTLSLAVSAVTLIPRPDTECLVEQALALELPACARVLDLGSGTGAIALALASERPGWQVWGADRQPEAVALAEHNGRSLGLERVQFLTSDWFSEIPAAPFDLIVSNPPYIPEQDPHLAVGDVRFEPRSALVSGSDGLEALRLIVTQATDYLLPGGWLILEHGYDQAEAVATLLGDAGYDNIGLRYDYGGQPRISQGQWRGEA